MSNKSYLPMASDSSEYLTIPEKKIETEVKEVKVETETKTNPEIEYHTLVNPKGECVKISRICLLTCPCQHWVTLIDGTETILFVSQINTYLLEHQFPVFNLHGGQVSPYPPIPDQTFPIPDETHDILQVPPSSAGNPFPTSSTEWEAFKELLRKGNNK